MRFLMSEVPLYRAWNPEYGTYKTVKAEHGTYKIVKTEHGIYKTVKAENGTSKQPRPSNVHIIQPRPDAGPSFQVRFVETFQGFPSSLGSRRVLASHSSFRSFRFFKLPP